MDSVKRKELIDAYLGRLKSRGVDIAEDAVIILIEETFQLADDVIVATENKYDDLARPFLPMAKNVALELADQIDGKQG